MSRRTTILGFVLVMALLIQVPAATAIDVPVTGEGPFSAPDGPSVTLDTGDGTDLNFSDNLFSDGQVRFNTSEGIVEFRSDATTNATIATNNISGEWTNVTGLDVSQANLTVDAEGKAPFSVGKDVDHVAVRDSISVGDGVADFRYGGDTGSTLLILNNVPANTDLAAVDSDTGDILGGTRSDSIGTAVFDDLDNSDHTVELEENEHAPTVDNPSADPQDNPTVRWQNETLSIDVDDQDLPDDELDVEFTLDGSVVNTTTIESAGTVSHQVTGLSEGKHSWNVTVTDAAGQTTTSETFAFTVDHHDPVLEDGSPEGDIDFEPDALSANISDKDFDKDGDTVDVTFELDGEQVGTDTLTSNGMATTNIDPQTGGPHTVTVTMTDSYGQSVTDSYSFSVPANVTVYDESSPTEPVSNLDVQVRFFGSEEIFERSTGTNGRVNMTGLPVSEPFVVRATPPDDSNFTSRRIYIDSIYEQESVYLLNTVEQDSNDLTFSVEDETGQFATSDTIFEISRPLEKDFNGDGNTTTQYRRISGDFLDASGDFPATLETGQRYRVRVKNSDGDVRELGAVTPRSDRVFNLRIQGLDGNASNIEKGWVMNTSQNVTETDSGPVKSVQFQYQDADSLTTELQIVVHEAGNASNVFDSTTVTNASGLGSYSYTQLFSSDEAVNTSLVANYTIVRDGVEITGTTAFGSQDYEIAEGLSADWGAIFGVGFLIVLAGLFSVANARIGALIVPGAAMVLYATGIITAVASAAAIGLAFAVAVGFNVMRTSGAVLNK